MRQKKIGKKKTDLWTLLSSDFSSTSKSTHTSNPNPTPHPHPHLHPPLQELESNQTTVVLHHLAVPSAGTYRCEVSAEAPLFNTVSRSGKMEIVGGWKKLCSQTDAKTATQPVVVPLETHQQLHY